MKNDLTTGTWQDAIWCPIIIISFCTSDVVLFVGLVFLALHTSVPGIQSWKKVILFERNQIITPVPKLPWITLFWHNRDWFHKFMANSLACILMEQQSLLIITLIMFMFFHDGFNSWREYSGEACLWTISLIAWSNFKGEACWNWHFSDKGFHDDCISCN